ncbi:MAG: hypothetical protein HY092_02020 [Candidatus Kerfeldbacteria bacterium]|nr:hypothetical protein [Candidatus Kerfeldbacteria bacterium]
MPRKDLNDGMGLVSPSEHGFDFCEEIDDLLLAQSLERLHQDQNLKAVVEPA